MVQMREGDVFPIILARTDHKQSGVIQMKQNTRFHGMAVLRININDT